MPFIYRPRRYRAPRRFSLVNTPEKRLALLGVIIVVMIGASVLPATRFLRDVSGQIALSDATDMVTAIINDKINEKMSEGQYDYDYFVSLERDSSGGITAISANMTRINTISSEILQEVIKSTNSGQLNIEIPVGNLMGSNLMLGRGPDIPVKIIMLTSSYADFRNEIVAAGINQLKHQIILELRVDIDVLLPWEVQSTEVLSEVLIAETIIVGKVPDTYLSLHTLTGTENTNGR
ncbi:MAG: sporulation protein YunB [Oscillospiraceae bacterium]|nr:sporulation protein YunB [Oscillospiraceae bacterium]